MQFRWPIRAFGECRGENVPGSGLTCLLLATQCTQFFCGPVGVLQLVFLREFVYCFNLLLHASAD